MKTERTYRVLCRALAFLLTVLSLSMHNLPAAIESADSFTVSDRGPDYRVWRKQTVITNESGVRTNVASYTELAGGMHYFDGEWRESRDDVEIVPDGAAATHAQTTVHWNANLNTFGSVTARMSDGRVLRSHPWALVFYDAATQQSALVAQLQNSDGVLLPPSDVLYPGAFGTIADVRYRFQKSGYEQDILIRRNISPADYGLNPDTTRLEVWTEFVEPPEPVKTERTLPNGFVDQSLDFGLLRMARGAAFLLGEANEQVAGTRVFKTWVKTAENRSFLIETLPFREIAAGLATLPPAQAAVGQPEKNARMALMKRDPPPRSTKEARPMRMAAKMDFDRTKALVVDYVTLNMNTNSLTLQGDTTYYVSSAFGVTNLTIEGGTVVKYASGAYIQVYGPIDCQTAAYSPAVFTAKDDHTIGQAVSTNTLSGYYANPCLLLDSTATLHDVRFSHARFGIIVGYDTTITNAQFTFCEAPIQLSLCNLTVDNVLFYKGTNVFHGGADTVVTARHLTMHQYGQFVYAPDNTFSIKLTNSLLVNVTNWGTANYSTNAVVKVASDSVFQTVGAGAHYLADGSSYRNAGTTNIPAWLLADVRLRTTYPPLLLTNTVTVSTNLGRAVARGSGAPDLGYAYAAIDYAANHLLITNNSTVTIDGGTVVAAWGNSAIWLKDGSRLVSEGTPLRPNHFLRFHAVQELSTNWGNSTVPVAIATHAATAPPSISLRFTSVECMANGGYHFFCDGGVAAVEVRDSMLYGGSGYFGGSPADLLAWTNNVFDRVSMETIFGHFYFFNNHARGGHHTIDDVLGSGDWIAGDNVFDRVTITETSSITHSNNTYIAIPTSSDRFTPTNATDYTLPAAPWFTNGPLGNLYHRTVVLSNAGCRTAASASLYHYTTITSQEKESYTMVDRGFHYVALTNGIPFDTDGDDLPDYLEDARGGDWQVHKSPGDLIVWGSNANGQKQLPWYAVNVIAAAGGVRHSLALLEGGSPVAWGTNDFGQTNVASGASNLLAVACGDDHSLALRDDGVVFAWGRNQSSQTNIPSGVTNVIAISAGGNQSLALLRNGSVVQWGQTNASIPANVLSNVSAIASGTNFHLALLTNKTVVAWGTNTYGQTDVPTGLTNVVAVAAGGAHALALRTDGKIVSWGAYSAGQTNVPSGLSNVMGMAAGHAHSIAVRNDGTTVAWGDNTYGQTNIPTLLTNAHFVAAGAYHSLGGIESQFLDYIVDVSRDLLLICNTNVESVFVKNYYLANRPMVTNANVLTIGYAAQETISRPDFTNVFRTPVLNWLTNNPTKRPRYWILFLDVPSRISDYSTNLGVYPIPFINPRDLSTSYELSLLPAARNPLITHINMGTTNRLTATNACKAYIDKLAFVGGNYSSGKLIISARGGGYANTNYYFDDVREAANAESGLVASNARNAVIQAGVPVISIIYSNGVDPDGGTDPSKHILVGSNVAAYLSWGAHSALGAGYATNNSIVWTGNSRWWIIETIESNNGMQYANQGSFIKWFSETAWGGTNYLNTPVGAVSHTDEPGFGINDERQYFPLWVMGRRFAQCAWVSRQTVFFQAVGDPFVTK